MNATDAGQTSKPDEFRVPARAAVGRPAARPHATMSHMEIWEDRQRNPIADEVSALVAVTGPVIAGVLRSVSAEFSNAFGERDQIPLKMLGPLRKAADGDCGIAFEYAVHDAVNSRDPIVVERIADALDKCGIARGDPASILFAMEKSGAQELISTEPRLVTDNSPVLLGEDGHPVSLRDSLSAIGAAFRLPGSLSSGRQSIRGLWRTELFFGTADLDRWVRASVRIGRALLARTREPRIVVVPRLAGSSDAVRFDEQKNIVLCPVPHDQRFIRIFHEGWNIVQALCASDFEVPGQDYMPSPLHREVARIYAERREFPILEVIEATRKFAQSGLITTSTEIVPNVQFATTAVPSTSIMITPIARTSTLPAEENEAARQVD